jgi:hypothetical protein
MKGCFENSCGQYVLAWPCNYCFFRKCPTPVPKDHSSLTLVKQCFTESERAWIILSPLKWFIQALLGPRDFRSWNESVLKVRHSGDVFSELQQTEPELEIHKIDTMFSQHSGVKIKIKIMDTWFSEYFRSRNWDSYVKWTPGSPTFRGRP